MFRFEQLTVYQESIDFSYQIYTLTKSWPRDELFGMISQARRAVVSISLNIADGSSRTKKDFQHFLDLSRGSCYELVTILKISRDLHYINDDEFNDCYETCSKLASKISALKNSLR